ncbi:MAG: ThuA domain-containing protein [Verrucomicrobia bacterium]|nr:ThuA domain-containing protein [Verrucomicrobiota bacterium]
MPRLVALALLAALTVTQAVLAAGEPPLRVFIRSGPKSHGPGAHDYPRFLAEWVPLLNARGAQATGANAFPTREQLAQTDVLILHAQEAGNIPAAEDRANLLEFLKRGGGIIAIHAGAVSRDPDWFKSIMGGSWRFGTTKWLEAPMHLYFTDRDHPLTRDVSNWAMNDEIYYDMDLRPDIRVLAAAYTPKSIDTGGRGNREAQARAAEAVATRKGVNIYDIQPQIWTYERTVEGAARPYRALVSLPGHLYVNFDRPNYRAFLLRGIAWAGQRANVDALCRPDELGDALRYPPDGPTPPAKAAARLEVHPEFNLSLVAAEPLIHKVMNLDWDERGRLWVCETPEYPNGRHRPNVEPWKDSGSLRGARVDRDPEDRISILTDTDGDGVMDKKHVFADKLELVTSFVFHRNGVIAAAAPDIWFLEDTDGDGVADRRTRLYTGLGTRDTHAVINNLRWGLDGWIYATHGYSQGEVKSGDGQKAFGTGGSGVVRFKPDGSAFEQFNSKNGNTWGLEVTWDGQVFWTQPTSGTVFFHALLPEAILARGKIPGTTSWKGMMTNQRSFPLMDWPDQAYVQIDQVGRFTAAAGCAIYEGGAWPEKWNYSYFTTEPTLNLVHHQFVRPEGTSYAIAKEAGREETEFIRSRDLWFRPIETRIGPDGALYVIDFYNQAVIHNDTRGPQHGPANAAVRPDRDHYFARIWRVQHKEAKRLEVPVLDRTNLPALLQTIDRSPNAHVKKLAWRLVQENHGAAGAKALAGIQRPPIGSRAQQRYESARAATTPAQRQAVLADFAAASDDWMRSALVAAAADRAADYLSLALVAPNPVALVPFATALAPSIPLDRATSLLQACANAPLASAPLKAAILRGLSQLSGAPAYLDATTTRLIQRLLAAPDTVAATLPLVAKWDRTGTLVTAAEPFTRQMLRDLVDRAQTDTRRMELAASLLAFPKTRAEGLKAITGLLGENVTSEALRQGLVAALGGAPGQDTDAALVAAFKATKLPAVFEQIAKRPESALALLAALRKGDIASGDVGPTNLARLRTHPNRKVASEAAEVLAHLNPAAAEKDALIARLLPEVSKPGNVANGKMLFTGACAICHKFGDVGLRDVGPPLAGIGAKGIAELLTHIVDPNRQVEPNYTQWNVTSRKGETHVGIIVNENNTSLTLRNQGGDTEVRKDDIATRENTRRSLMPEGLEGLGAEGLRDVIAFLVAGSGPAPATTSPTQSAPSAPAAPPAVDGPKEGGRNDRPLPATEPVTWEPGKKRVLLIGGGSSHKFTEFFGVTDSATLRKAGFSVHYTEDRDQAAAALAEADVAVISVNRMFFDMPAYRKAVFAFAAAGKGIVMLHPGTWYAYPRWPELNAHLVGGGSRGHDKLGPYSVHVLKADHPILRGVPAKFEVIDELYYMNAEPEKIPPGTAPIEVLAESSPSLKFQKPHPVVWITRHESARIVGFTLGHDERVHDHPAFQAILVNAVDWVSRK